MTSRSLTLQRLANLSPRPWPLATLSHGGHLGPLASLLVLAFIGITIAYQFLGMVQVVAGPRDNRFIHNAHELEPLEQTDQWMRWTTAETTIALPLVAAHAPLIVSLQVMNHYPPDFAPPVATLSVGERALLTFSPHRESRHYRLLLPPQERLGWSVPFTLQSTTQRTVIDSRQLGVVLAAARLLPTAGIHIPPLWQVVACLLGSAAAYTTFHGIGVPRWWAWVAALVLVLVWVVLLATLPMQIAPFTMRVAALCCLGAVYGLVVMLLTEYVYDQAWVSLSHLLLLMGVAYWLMPVYQVVMTLDGVEGVSPYIPTVWVALALLLSLAVGLGILALRGQLAQWRGLVIGGLALASVARLVFMLEFVMADKNVYIEGVAINGVAAICIGVGFGVVALSAWLQLRPRQIALVALPALAIVVSALSQYDTWQGRGGPDFWILFKGARDWFQGGSLYNIPGIIENHFGHSFKVPPFYGMLFVPFVQKDGLTILFWHRVINMLLLSGILLLLLRGLNVPLFSVPGAGLIMLFNMRPIADTVAFGQIDIMLLLLLTIALVASQRGYDGWAGAAVALGALFKLYPVLLLAFFVVKQRWRALVGFALAMLVCNGLALAIMGWEMHATYLFEVVPRIGGGTAWVENQTLNGFLSRIFAPEISSTVFVHPLVSLLTYAGFGVASAGAAFLAWQPAVRGSPRALLQFGLFVLLMVLVVPAAWMHYQTIVLLSFVGVLLYAGEFGLPRWCAALVGLSYAIIAYGNAWSYYLNKIMGVLTFVGISFKFYALLLLLAVMVALLLDQTDQVDRRRR